MSGDLPEMVQFIGRLHVLLVHLPIGFIVLLAVIEVLATRARFKQAAGASGAVLALSVIAVIFSAACGWVLSWSGGYDEQTLTWHKWLGTALAPVAVVLALLRWKGLTKAYKVWLFATVVLLGVTGHFGGSLTHGSDFLFAFKKSDVSHSEPPEGGTPSLDKPVFATMIQPIFNEYCIGCHGAEKSKAGLRLDTVENAFKGGDSGPVIAPGAAAQSLMMKRLLLPLDDDDHMPPSEKSQPSSSEIALLKWWINVGAPVDKAVDDLKMPEVK